MNSWLQWLLFLGFGVVIVASFITPAPQQQIGESSRILYYHVPQAMICFIAFAAAAFSGWRYLSTRKLVHDSRSMVACEIGVVTCILATVTGSIFAKEAWGSFWNWDPRETSIFLLLLIYGAYFALRGSIEEPERKARLSAVYAIFAFPPGLFLIFLAPRIMPSLHPTDTIIDAEMKPGMSPEVRMIFYPSVLLFVLLYIWMYQLRVKSAELAAD